MNFKGFSFLHLCVSALKRRALKRNYGPLCALLLASLMTQFVGLSFFFLTLSEARKCFLLKGEKKTLTYSFEGADSVLSDNQDKTDRTEVHRAGLSHYPFPYLDHVEFRQKGSKLSVGATLSSPS